jgi:hypothetical protein
VCNPRKAEGVAGSAKGNGVGSGISSGGTGIGTRSYVPGRRVGSAGSRYTGSGVNRGVSPRGAGSVSSGSGASGESPGGGARGSLVPGPSEARGSAAVALVPSAGVLASSSEEEWEPWIGARGVPGAMTVGTRSGVGTASSS